MRQTSEEFVNAMLTEERTVNESTSFAEKLAQAEQRLTEKIEESNREFMEKLAGLNLDRPLDVSRETSEETNDTIDESNDSSNDENNIDE